MNSQNGPGEGCSEPQTCNGYHSQRRNTPLLRNCDRKTRLPQFGDRFRSFSPSARNSEDILRNLKDQFRRDSDMFLHTPDWGTDRPFSKADDFDDWTKRSFEEMRARPPVFRMPHWASEDADMSNLTTRMSQTPHWATMGRRGPASWRDRRGSGSSDMSEGDVTDSPRTDRSTHGAGGSQCVTHEIPIRIEAEAPPGLTPQEKKEDGSQNEQENKQQQPGSLQHSFSDPAASSKGGSQVMPEGHTGKEPEQILSLNESHDRNASRCSSAPPEVADKVQQQRFVSRVNLAPQNGHRSSFLPNSHFNNVAKPFVPTFRQQEQEPIEETCENTLETPVPKSGDQSLKVNLEEEAPQQRPSTGTQRSGVVRNIPIFIEGRGSPVDGDAHSASAKLPRSYIPPRPQPFTPKQPFPSEIPLHHPSSPPQTQQVPVAEEQKTESPVDVKMDKIAKVRGELNGYVKDVESFTGKTKDKQFLYLDEMLTRALIHLDDIDPDGRDDVRQARRYLIKDVNATISKLENKLLQNTNTGAEIGAEEGTKVEITDQNMEVDESHHSEFPPDTRNSEHREKNDETSGKGSADSKLHVKQNSLNGTMANEETVQKGNTDDDNCVCTGHIEDEKTPEVISMDAEIAGSELVNA